MPKYSPLITRQAWHWHLSLEKAVKRGIMIKEPDDFTISGYRYVPIENAKHGILQTLGKIEATIGKEDFDEVMD